MFCKMYEEIVNFFLVDKRINLKRRTRIFFKALHSYVMIQIKSGATFDNCNTYRPNEYVYIYVVVCFFSKDEKLKKMPGSASNNSHQHYLKIKK